MKNFFVFSPFIKFIIGWGRVIERDPGSLLTQGFIIEIPCCVSVNEKF